MRALIHFMYRGGWSFQILAAGCETLLIGYRRVQNKQSIHMPRRRISPVHDLRKRRQPFGALSGAPFF
jgi:hypothetical protein